MKCLVVIVAGIIIGVFFLMEEHNRAKKVNKIEIEELLPILNYLYKEPKSKLKDQEFFSVLKEIDKKIEGYKYTFYKYVPDRRVFEKLFRHLEKYPTDSAAHNRFEYIVARAKYINSNKVTAKQLVLTIGRWYFGKLRDGKPTIYDEQAIQNDISVRSR